MENMLWKRRVPDLFHHVITGDESYFHLYMPETKEQSKQWLTSEEPRPQKALRGRGTTKSVILVIFFDWKGVVYREFYRNETMTGAKYLALLQRLLTAIQHRRTEEWRRGTFVLHDDNARPHRCDLVSNWINCRHIRTMTHPAYSPDLALADFWLFPRLKKEMRGIRYPDQNVLEFETDRMLGQIPQYEFVEAILRKWPHRMRKCVRQEGHYFEGVR